MSDMANYIGGFIRNRILETVEKACSFTYETQGFPSIPSVDYVAAF
jgi:hypothetical protein